MFESRHSLPQLVPTSAYVSPAVLEEERRRLFDPAWHYVGRTDDLALPGGFITARILERPLIVWRAGDRVRCWLNVCPHRFARIVGEPCGKAEILRCPYHGWEFGADGRSRKIPEAVFFKPLGDHATDLREFPLIERAGLLFVNLSDSDFAAPEPALPPNLAELFPPALRPVRTWRYRVAANWKVVLENAVESYHIATVHTRTFKVSPRPDACRHELHPARTTFVSTEEAAGRLQRFADDWAYPIMGLTQSLDYHQTLVYPNLMLGKAGLFSWVHVVTPTAADESEIEFHFFMQTPKRKNPLSRLVAAAFRRGAVRFTDVAASEDAGVLPKVQAGLSSPVMPSGGLISIREERIYHLQRWWCDSMGDAAESRPTNDPSLASPAAVR